MERLLAHAVRTGTLTHGTNPKIPNTFAMHKSQCIIQQLLAYALWKGGKGVGEVRGEGK